MTPIFVRHGIRTKRTRPGWIHDYKIQTYRAYGPAAVHVDTEKYKAGATPVWNHLVVNPEQAKSMLVEYYSVAASFPGCERANAVAHSNGCNVTLEFLKQASEEGQRFGTVIFIGAAIHSDVEKTGVLELVRNGTVRQFVAYVSPNDSVVKMLENIPGFYGSLGAKGFHYKGKLISNHPYIQTRKFSGYSHSDYFTQENVSSTINQINSDFGL